MVILSLIPLVTAALDELGQKLDNARSRGDLAPQAWASAYLPTRSWLAGVLPATAQERRTSVVAYANDVRQRWMDVRTDTRLYDGLRSLPGRPWAVGSLPGIDTRGARVPEHRLEVDMEAAPGLLARDLVEQATSVSASALVTATATTATTVKALCAMRSLDNVAIRVLAAAEVARQTGFPFAEVLALYRLEGNLNAPPSAASLLELSVPAEMSIGFVPRSGAPERESVRRGGTAFLDLAYMPDISNEVWLGDPAKPRLSSRTEDMLLAFAASHVYGITLIGGDTIASSLSALAGATPDPAEAKARFASWSAGNWANAGLDGSESAAADRWDDVLEALESRDTTGLDSNRPRAVLVAPSDPVGLVTSVIREGVVFRRALRQTRSLLVRDGTFSDGFAYLRYNAAAKTKDVPTILLSALIDADANGKRRFPVLHSRIRGDVKALVDEARKLGANGREAAANLTPPATAVPYPMNATLGDWLNGGDTAGDNAVMLVEFIEQAGTDMWSAKSWLEHRRHLWRYRRLHRLYQDVFGSYPR